MPRSILFIDPPAFCTTVESIVTPRLRRRPVAIAAGSNRATVLALSSEASTAGIRRGMALTRARRLCPDLAVLPPNRRLYARASAAIHTILQGYAPVIEPRGYGHAFLDVTGTERLLGSPIDIAAKIECEARQRTRVPLLVGVATNKLVSQAVVRADRRAGGPGGGATDTSPLHAVQAGDEANFLAPHSLEVLPELDPHIRARLDDYQLQLIGEVAALTPAQICSVFGKQGRTLLARARGIDPRPVMSPEQVNEFHLAHTLGTDTNEIEILDLVLGRLAARLGRRLRLRALAARRLKVELTFSDCSVVQGGASLSHTPLDSELWTAARRAFRLALKRRVTVRSIALRVDQFVEADPQLDLWEMPALTKPRGEIALQQALDRIRGRHGERALMVGMERAVNGER